MPKRERVVAEVELKPKQGEGGCRGEIPAAVKNKLGVRSGDFIVFEEGSNDAVTRAAFKEGGYFVVSKKHAPKAEVETPREAVGDGPQLGDLTDDVKKRLGG